MMATHRRKSGTGSIHGKKGRFYVYSPERAGKRKLLAVRETRWAAERWLERWLEEHGDSAGAGAGT